MNAPGLLNFQPVSKLPQGLARERDGNTIIVTKIPKSSSLQVYLQESDSEKKGA